ncbi:uncharacterized protein LOC126759485 [Bactrocera neohumeralis]|uniref:uncharacterized protein LOC126759485 n=2 Tax=Bactrocera TaxID=47832 RepID=UPI00216580CD|nr:uncharacterized protein LOC126759485 [Bactrocera neohumeralis]
MCICICSYRYAFKSASKHRVKFIASATFGTKLSGIVPSINIGPNFGFEHCSFSICNMKFFALFAFVLALVAMAVAMPEPLPGGGGGGGGGGGLTFEELGGGGGGGGGGGLNLELGGGGGGGGGGGK